MRQCLAKGCFFLSRACKIDAPLLTPAHASVDSRNSSKTSWSRNGYKSSSWRDCGITLRETEATKKTKLHQASTLLDSEEFHRMKAVFLLAVVAIVFQSQLVAADPLSLLPITSLIDLVNNLGSILTGLIKTVLGLVCTVVGTLVGTITVFIPNLFLLN